MTAEPTPVVRVGVPRWTWGDRVRKVRRELDLTQEAFGQVIGVGQKSVASWESGTRSPRDAVQIAQIIEERVGVPAVWMLGLDAPGRVSHTGGRLTNRETSTYMRRGPRTRLCRSDRMPAGAA